MNEMLKKSYAEQFTEHKWEVEFDFGRVHLRCLDPCDTFECTPECERNKNPEVIRYGPTFNEVKEREACTCGQYARFEQEFEEANGRMCACMATGEEVDSLSGSIPIRIEFVDDSTPSSPWGGAEYSHYLVVHHPDAS